MLPNAQIRAKLNNLFMLLLNYYPKIKQVAFKKAFPPFMIDYQDYSIEAYQDVSQPLSPDMKEISHSDIARCVFSTVKA